MSPEYLVESIYSARISYPFDLIESDCDAGPFYKLDNRHSYADCTRCAVSCLPLMASSGDAFGWIAINRPRPPTSLIRRSVLREPRLTARARALLVCDSRSRSRRFLCTIGDSCSSARHTPGDTRKKQTTIGGSSARWHSLSLPLAAPATSLFHLPPPPLPRYGLFKSKVPRPLRTGRSDGSMLGRPVG